MGNHKLGDKVSAWLISDELGTRPSIWASGTIEDILYGGYYHVRLDTGELACVYQRYLRAPLGVNLRPGQTVGVNFDQMECVHAGADTATIVWVNADYALLDVPTDGDPLRVCVTIDRLKPMAEVH